MISSRMFLTVFVNLDSGLTRSNISFVQLIQVVSSSRRSLVSGAVGFSQWFSLRGIWPLADSDLLSALQLFVTTPLCCSSLCCVNNVRWSWKTLAIIKYLCGFDSLDGLQCEQGMTVLGSGFLSLSLFIWDMHHRASNQMNTPSSHLWLSEASWTSWNMIIYCDLWSVRNVVVFINIYHG